MGYHEKNMAFAKEAAEDGNFAETGHMTAAGGGNYE